MAKRIGTASILAPSVSAGIELQAILAAWGYLARSAVYGPHAIVITDAPNADIQLACALAEAGADLGTYAGNHGRGADPRTNN